ncbi:MAG: metal-dependent hydrolase [bacterium]|nr:metal-dependent hydrolase [bacterium]MCP5069441.1 metal-dependent hydrolase [bacterium]
MEPLTQALLGASVARVAAPKLGRRALFWGAVVGMLPDLDVLLAPLHGGYGELLYHRGSTHSLWFGPVVGPALGWILWRWRDPKRETTLRDWVQVCILALFTHPLLDWFTPYGTQLLAPFSRMRFSLNGVGIVDPFYTGILAIGLLAPAGLGLARAAPRRIGFALALSSLYLVGGVGLNQLARSDVARVLEVAPAEVRVYPTLLQPLMRRVVARYEGRVWAGWHTTLALGCPFGEGFPEPAATPESLELESTWQGQLMRWFAMDDVVVHTTRLPSGGALVEMEDLRYSMPGQPAARSLWGVRARYDAEGRRVGEVERFRRAPAERTTIAVLGDLTLGRFARIGIEADRIAGCDGSSTANEPAVPPSGRHSSNE